MSFRITPFLLAIMLAAGLQAQEMTGIYSGTVPNSTTAARELSDSLSNGVYFRVVQPGLEMYLPDSTTANGTAVIICPGGGYGVIVFDGEGVSTAKKLAHHGVAAFVLKYRLPHDALQTDKSIAPLQDAQQAMKFVRDNAAQWGIDTARIGIMGFSAGGHLASTLATHYRKAVIPNEENTSLRPDFQILVYPVISMTDSLTHMGSRFNLLGKSPTPEMIALYSNEYQVDTQSPPAYLTHASDDNLVDVDNSIFYYEALRKNGVPVEMHLYRQGDHGFIFRHEGWIDPLLAWMKDFDLISD